MDTTRRYFVGECFSRKAIISKFPIVNWLPKYRLNDLQCDVISGLTVALTVLPQSLAYAFIANVPAQYGLYSSFMGCFLYTLFGTSKDVTVGPTALQSLLTGSFALSPFENDASFAVLLCLISGVIQMVMGFLHMGILVNFISVPVFSGFLSAAAITIVLTQIKSLLGLNVTSKFFKESVAETFGNLPQTKKWDATMAAVCLVVLIMIKFTRYIKWKTYENGCIPLRSRIIRKFVWFIQIAANALVMICGAGVVGILEKDKINITDVMSITGSVKKGLPPFESPPFSASNGTSTIKFPQMISHLGAGSIIVPILGLVETIAVGKAFARLNNYTMYPNQELLAIGIGNILGSFVAAYPMAGSLSRTPVNAASGVRTPMGGVITGIIVLLALQFLTPLFAYIPKAALAAVIVVAVSSMVDYEILPKLWRVQKWALIPWFATLAASLGLGIEYGIVIGVGVQVLMLLYPIARPRITFKWIYSDDNLPYKHPFPEVHSLEHVICTFNQAIRFPSVEFLQGKIWNHMKKDGETPKSVVLNCKHLASGLDYTTVLGLTEMIADFKKKRIRFSLADVLPEIKHELENAGANDILYGETLNDAIKAIIDAERTGHFDNITNENHREESQTSCTIGLQSYTGMNLAFENDEGCTPDSIVNNGKNSDTGSEYDASYDGVFTIRM